MEKYLCKEDYIGNNKELFFKKGDIYEFRPTVKGWFKTNENNLGYVHEIEITDLKKCFEPLGKSEQLETPKHYDNSKGTLYKVATERGWNPYLFDIVKRLERAEKKGEFKTDLEKSINVIKLWLNESE